ncbi:hypothetical protein H4R18_005110 [Coemansia javaensis]|uniref:Uncharacterized protein n=1 Tax=Coemansia javaensis TaxID=2761396 RepID=A0A9W8LEU5_9FUNG|nr:hypothetical protein H4R18_005110 [Coemansia javaensis]
MDAATSPPGSPALGGRLREAAGDRRDQWARVHVQPLRAQLHVALERCDELLAARDEAEAQAQALRRELAAAQRRLQAAAAAADDAQQRADRLAEDNARQRDELAEQRAAWARRWAAHQAECGGLRRAAELDQRAEPDHHHHSAGPDQRVADLQAQLGAALAEAARLRSQAQRLEAERADEWEPLRARWLAGAEQLCELQDAHRDACEALAAAQARLAELEADGPACGAARAGTERATTSLLGELDDQRGAAVAQRQALERDHAALRRAYGRAQAAQARMRQQVARLTQLAAAGASDARVRRLEAALGDAECQRQVLTCAAALRPGAQPGHADVDADADADADGGGRDATALAASLRARLRHALADRDQAQRELRTAHLLRANELQRAQDLERAAADADARLRRAAADIAALRAANEQLRRAADPVPPRKRTRVSPGPAGPDPHHHGRRAMSVAFVVNPDASRPPSPAATSSGQSATPSGQPATPDQPAKHPAASPTPGALPVGLSALSDATDRGLKTWLGSLGAAHAPAPAADDDQPAPGPFGSEPTASPARPRPPVDEIHIDTHTAQRSMDCNNQ